MRQKAKLLLTLAVLSFISLLVGSSWSTTAFADDGARLTYHVYISPGKPGRVQAELEGVRKPVVQFNFISDGNTGIDLLGNISAVKAYTPDGVSLPVSRKGSGWSVETKGHTRLTFEYTFGTSLRDSRPEGFNRYYVRVTDEGAFIMNRAIFSYPDVPLSAVYVRFDKPRAWTVGTSFLPVGKDLYKVEGKPTLELDLIANVTRLGVAAHVVSEKCGDINITFIAYRPPREGYEAFWYPWYGNTPEQQMHDYIDLVCKSIRYFTAHIGPWPGGSRYWISTFSSGGSEVPTYYNHWMQAWPRERYDQVPHHVLHAWIFREAPLQFAAPEQWWFAEGIPMFYQHELTTKFIGGPWRGKHYGSYLIMRRAAQFGLLGKRSIEHYAYGEMRALALDSAVRKATGGKKSLIDVLKRLYQTNGTSYRPIHRSDMISAINEVSGTDLSSFYNQYLAGEFNQLPPVGSEMPQYYKPFLQWIDTFVAPKGRGCDAGGSRTVFFIALEIGIHKSGYFSALCFDWEWLTGTASGF